MLRATFMLTMVIAAVALKTKNTRGMGAFEATDDAPISKEEGQMESAEKVADMLSQIEKEDAEKATVVPSVSSVVLDAKTRDASIAEAKADAKMAEAKADAVLKDGMVGSNAVQPVESVDPIVHTDSGFSVKEGKYTVPDAGSRGQTARTQSWEAKESSGGSWTSTIMLLILIGCGVAAAAAMSSAVKTEKGAGVQEMQSMATSVSLGVKPRAAPAALPKGLNEVDVLETFDSFDKMRRGFIDSDVLEGLVGPDEAAQEAARQIVGNVDKLFYHDFRKLALQKGPVQDAVMNTASRKRGATVECVDLINA